MGYKKKILLNVLLWGFSVIAIAQNQSLEESFKTPPSDCYPTVWWRWMGSQVSREGITADLESLKAVGIGGVHLFQIAPSVNEDNILGSTTTKLPKLQMLSPEWWETIQYAVKEADRLGLSFSVQNCLGYSTNGGPWITPEMAMQRLVWSEVDVEVTSSPVSLMLEQPVVDQKWNYYKDIAVLGVKMVQSGEAVSLCDIHEITSYMQSDGKLIWNAPKGRWRIFRYGHTVTGAVPHPVPNKYNGLECDKMNREAIKLHFENYAGRMLREAGPLAGRTFSTVLLDSYEAGSQNWTPRLREEFNKRRGYDPLPWLPVYKVTELRKTGFSPLGWLPESSSIVIGDKDQTERFRYDMEQTISELFIEENVAVIKDLTHQYPGVKFEVQPYNSMYNFITGGRSADLVAGEFWHRMKSYGWWTLKLAASASHIMGNAVVPAEAFTATPSEGNWDVTPADLKTEGDLAFAKGVNSFELHVMAHQPWNKNVKPGMTSQMWGTQINRNNTWWNQSAGWLSYLSRSQYLLRRGRFVGDICYLYPRFQKGYTVPVGYDGDAIDERAILDLMNIENGCWKLSSGMSYKIMVLPENQKKMTPQLIFKLKELVGKGGILIGRKPECSPSLQNYPACDELVKKIASELWGDYDGSIVTEHTYGLGKVIWGKTQEQVLAGLNIPKDFELAGEQMDEETVAWIHRKLEDADLYFVSNQKDSAVNWNALFRVSGRKPELWNAVDGTMRQAENWKQEGERMRVSLRMKPKEALFVLFRTATVSDGSEIVTNRKVLQDSLELEKAWKVTFNPAIGQPFDVKFQNLISWDTSNDKRIKYFSGTANYFQSFRITKEQLTNTSIFFLNLGEVKEIAEVFVNGNRVSLLWLSPFTCDITSFLKVGVNRLELRVTNTWTNRLIGDEQEPDDMKYASWSNLSERRSRGVSLTDFPYWFVEGQSRPSRNRMTFTTHKFYHKSDKLLSSGLLGKVKILIYK